jgi:hypothetical protein
MDDPYDGGSGEKNQGLLECVNVLTQMAWDKSRRRPAEGLLLPGVFWKQMFTKASQLMLFCVFTIFFINSRSCLICFQFSGFNFCQFVMYNFCEGTIFVAKK